MDTDAPVTLGVWTNWSRGPTMGKTLTTTRENGNLLIAFTAFLVPFVATRLWRIVALVLHQFYSTSASRDAIHHQRQVILRNSGSAQSGLWSFAELVWAWRSVGGQPRRRVVPIILGMVCFIVAFTVAGGFSSSIAYEAGEVLLEGDNCQAGTDRSTGDATAVNAVRSYWALFINDMANYAKNCYANQTSGMMECSRFVIGAVPTSFMDYNALCPFEQSICRRERSNIKFDTGHLDSNAVFGLNTRPGETFTLRYVLQCAPLATEGRTHNISESGRNYTAYREMEFDFYRTRRMIGTEGPSPTEKVSTYLTEEAASPLGCIDQFQWCRDPALGQCGNLTNQHDALYSAAPWFGLTLKDLDSNRPVAQNKAGSLLLWAHYMLFNAYSLSGIVDILGSASLASQAAVVQGLVFSPKENQWQLDVTQWWNIVLSVFQAKFVITAQGSGNSTSQSETIKPENGNAADTANTATLSGKGNTAIQLHRLLQDQLGHGNWDNCDETIPTTRPGDLLARFDISNPKHPLLAEKTPDNDGQEMASQTPPDQQTSQGSPSQPGYEVSLGRTSPGARQPLSDANSQPQGVQQERPRTAP
ncbi:hypothetical protein PG996_014565 [Apiospora saccharicola]|uniref:Uncharacterized protein n=1 Tax=Apiospora saccharicola TaxID=335842 RepID=A0ABR1TIP1_9PEZI